MMIDFTEATQNMRDIKLSVIIPYYNGEKWISKCLDSLLKQDLTESEYEIIVVNDGSTHRLDELEKYEKDLKDFDIREWYNKKRANWELLRDIKKDGVRVLGIENMGCYPFSLVLLFDSLDERDRVRKELIAHQIYPAILWNVPSPTEGEIFQISRGMLSIHCDGRYNAEDIQQMRTIIESIL